MLIILMPIDYECMQVYAMHDDELFTSDFPLVFRVKCNIKYENDDGIGWGRGRC